MDRKYWLQWWAQNRPGLHQAEYNRWLLAHWPTLGIAPGAQAFLPMCGKSRDLHWLVENGYTATGIDFSPLAIESYFEECGEPYELQPGPNLPCYEGARTRIYCGDFFDLTARELADTAAVFDRAALVVLAAADRRRYVDHLLRVVPDGTWILLVTCEYDQNLAAGPPFAVHVDEVHALYGERCDIELLETGVADTLPPHFAGHGVTSAAEQVWRIRKTA
jgi:thiopurine S-methyltransferase